MNPSLEACARALPFKTKFGGLVADTVRWCVGACSGYDLAKNHDRNASSSPQGPASPHIAPSIYQCREDAGASAVVLYSFFEEQLQQEGLELEHHLNAGTETSLKSSVAPGKRDAHISGNIPQ